MRHLPNALTITRILVTPVLLLLLLSDTLLGQMWAFALFVFAAISDYLDGKLARSFSVGSRLGQFLDPFADKVLVLGTFAALAYLIPHVVPWWAVALIAARDVGVTLLRTWAESRGRSIHTKSIAKSKTLVQLIFLIVLLLLVVVAKMPGSLGRGADWLLGSSIPFVALLLVVAFTIVTGVLYALNPKYVSSVKLNG